MISHHENKTNQEDIRFCLQKFRDLLEVLPEKKGDAFNWDELIQSKEVVEKALKRIPLTADFRNVNPFESFSPLLCLGDDPQLAPSPLFPLICKEGELHVEPSIQANPLTCKEGDLYIEPSPTLPISPTEPLFPTIQLPCKEGDLHI